MFLCSSCSYTASATSWQTSHSPVNMTGSRHRSQQIARANRSTAKRDLEDLVVKKGVLTPGGSGRGAYYEMPSKRLRNGPNGSPRQKTALSCESPSGVPVRELGLHAGNFPSDLLQGVPHSLVRLSPLTIHLQHDRRGNIDVVVYLNFLFPFRRTMQTPSILDKTPLE